jgi:hypothetical protein
MVAWTLACRSCRTPLSVPLTELELDAAPVQLADGLDAIPRGCMWRAHSGFAAFGQLGVGDLLCCRRDLPGAQDGNGRIGCCGPNGLDGPNLRCVCGSDIATQFGDCWQPHVVCVQQKRVTCEPATPEVAVHVYPPEEFQAAHRSAWAFAGWLHELLGAQEWYGLELDALVREWAAGPSTPIVIVWLDVQREHAAGVPVDELLAHLSGSAITVVPMSAP